MMVMIGIESVTEGEEDRRDWILCGRAAKHHVDVVPRSCCMSSLLQ
jgi:hypothetical protein